jgi:hypothetical protein
VRFSAIQFVRPGDDPVQLQGAPVKSVDVSFVKLFALKPVSVGVTIFAAVKPVGAVQVEPAIGVVQYCSNIDPTFPVVPILKPIVSPVFWPFVPLPGFPVVIVPSEELETDKLRLGKLAAFAGRLCTNTPTVSNNA